MSTQPKAKLSTIFFCAEEWAHDVTFDRMETQSSGLPYGFKREEKDGKVAIVADPRNEAVIILLNAFLGLHPLAILGLSGKAAGLSKEDAEWASALNVAEFEGGL